MDNAPLLMVLPILRRLRLPVTRDGAMLLLMAVTQFFLGLDTYLAHQISGTIVPREWIPIAFGPLAGVCLLAAGVLARRQRMAANLLATVVFLASIVVGVLGSYFHIVRAMRPFAAAGQQLTLSLLVWAPPLLGPICSIMPDSRILRRFLSIVLSDFPMRKASAALVSFPSDLSRVIICFVVSSDICPDICPDIFTGVFSVILV